MGNNNFISYLSTGQDSFTCEFSVEKEEQIEVIVEDKLLEYLNDYTIEDFDKKVKIIKLKEKLGSALYPKLIILKRNADIQRITNFQDDSQIKANLLNLEFNNLVNNQVFLKDFLVYLSTTLLPKDEEDNNEGNGGDDNNGNGEGNEGESNGESEGLLDPRNWSEEINIVDLEDYFDIGDFKEISIVDPKPFTHNTYFIYARNPADFPDNIPYRLTNFAKLSEPCSVKFYIDKRICFKGDASEYARKIYVTLGVGGMKVDVFNIYATSQAVICNEVIDGGSIMNLYKDIFDSLHISQTDEFVSVQKYFLDPIRGY